MMSRWIAVALAMSSGNAVAPSATAEAQEGRPRYEITAHVESNWIDAVADIRVPREMLQGEHVFVDPGRGRLDGREAQVQIDRVQELTGAATIAGMLSYPTAPGATGDRHLRIAYRIPLDTADLGFLRVLPLSGGPPGGALVPGGGQAPTAQRALR